MRRSIRLAVLMLLAALLAPTAARAEQIVLFDITYTHDASNDAHKSISGAQLNQPANWTAPINYAQGTIHFYQEVMTKPSLRDTIIDFCLMSVRDYGCIETFIYKTVGLHETTRSMAGRDVDKRNVIDFTQRMRSIQMVLKTPAPTYINGGSPKSDFLPSKMRFVATLVSPGGTYIRPTPTPGFDPGPAARDAGSGPTFSDGGSPGADAAPAPDPVTPPIDAPVVVMDAAVAPPPVDAPTSPPPPPSSVDAATGKPPSNPRPDPAPAPTPAPSAPVAGSCSMGGSAPPPALVVGVLAAGLVMLRRRRRPQRPHGHNHDLGRRW